MAASAISDNPQDRAAATFAAPEPAIHGTRIRSRHPPSRASSPEANNAEKQPRDS